MREIRGRAASVRQLLKDTKYSIDYYQREYKWQEKQIRELIDDLTGKFLEEHDLSHGREKVADYPHYFLGSIIISKKDNTNYIVDGQQRLTSLTLLLLLLRSLQTNVTAKVNVDDLVVSERYGLTSFNLSVDERDDCLLALWEGRPFDPTGKADSVRNLLERYQDLEEVFPAELRGRSLPYFIDWLLDNVHLVEITAYSDEDAYTIFETMNDRGLSLSPTDMLKGYLLANIDDPTRRQKADNAWRSRLRELTDIDKEVDADFFKAWFRGKYATKIRERKKGAHAEDFDRIGTEFHRWLRDASGAIGLQASDDFYQFLRRDFDFYSRWYIELMQASDDLVEGLEHVAYNSDHGFTLQYMLLLAPLNPDDDRATALAKIRIVARYLDIMLNRRLWNFRSIAYSTMQYAMFIVMRDIRSLDVASLSKHLHASLERDLENFDSNDRFRMHQQNRWSLHRILARITDYVGTQSGEASHYESYLNVGKVRYEIEHIWADHPERHDQEFTHPREFAEHRNLIGGLLLLPKSLNASYGDRTYEEKLPHYNTQNLLARSLHSQSYTLNPGFLQFVSQSGLPFRPYEHFLKADLEERSDLYRQIAKHVWNPDDLQRDAST